MLLESQNPRRRWLPQFSLRTLVLLMWLAAAGFGFWWRGEPWGLYKTISFPMMRTYSLTPIYSHSGEEILFYNHTDSKIHLWKKGQFKRVFHLPPNTQIHHVQFARDDKSIQVSTGGRKLNGMFLTIDTATGQKGLRVLNPRKAKSGYAGFVPFTLSVPGAESLIIGSYKTPFLFNTKADTPVANFLGHTKTVWIGELSPSGDRFATAGEDQKIILWDPHTAIPKRTLKWNTSQITQLSFSPSGHRILAAGMDGSKVWDVSTGSDLGGYRNKNSKWIEFAEFNLTGNQIILLEHDSSIVKFLDSRKHEIIYSLDLPEIIDGLDMHPEGAEIILCSGARALIYRRRYPEWWWGIACTWEFWATLALGLGTVCSMSRDWKDLSVKQLERTQT